jgi:host factor-I protein
MATEKAQNVQDVFLNTLRKKKMPVTVFLSSGVKLQGNITGFDNFCIVLRRGPQVQLVYKHAIATVVPSGALSLYEEEEGSGEEEAATT